MFQELKSEIKEIIEIVNQCPEEFKGKCFEILLENYLNTTNKKNKSNETNNSNSLLPTSLNQPITSNEEPQKINTEEIYLNDFHVKTQRFLLTNNIDIANINQIYYKENGKLEPLYESLKSTKMSECQIRLALLTAFENSFENPNGEMTFNGEIIRKRCQDMKCYDASSFTKIFTYSANYFDNWQEKYDKKIDYILSTDGKKQLATILIDLAEGE